MGRGWGTRTQRPDIKALRTIYTCPPTKHLCRPLRPKSCKSETPVENRKPRERKT